MSTSSCNRQSNREIKRLVWLISILSMLAGSSVQAVRLQEGDSVNFSFTGTLLAMTPCTINNDKVIDVQFNNVGINKVESGVYIKDIEYSLHCGSAGSTNTILMTLKATTVASSSSIVATSAKGLWAQFYKDGSELTLNQEFIVNDPNSPPKIQVKLVKDPSEDFVEGAFTAILTLVSEYM